MQDIPTPAQIGTLTEEELIALSKYRAFQALREALHLTIHQLVITGVVRIAVLPALEEWIGRLLES